MAKKSTKKSGLAAPRPKVFIGSSTEGLPIAQAIGANLEHVVDSRPWPTIFDLSENSVESLEKAAEECKFAIFVITPDDDLKFRGAKLKAARDNVLWEHGLFSGKNGRRRTFIVMPRDVQNLKLPYDLLGVTPATYDSSSLKGDAMAALSTACYRIYRAIEAAVNAEAASPAAPTATPPPASASAPVDPHLISMSPDIFKHLCGICILKKYEYHNEYFQREMYWLKDHNYIKTRSPNTDKEFHVGIDDENLAELWEPTEPGLAYLKLHKDDILELKDDGDDTKWLDPDIDSNRANLNLNALIGLGFYFNKDGTISSS